MGVVGLKAHASTFGVGVFPCHQLCGHGALPMEDGAKPRPYTSI